MEREDSTEDSGRPTPQAAQVNGPLSLDAVFNSLATTRRRVLLRRLRRADDAVVSVDDLVADVVATEETLDCAGPADPERAQVERTLHHRDLPKLADLGVIDYDAHSDTVRYYSDPRLEDILDAADDSEVA